MLALWTKVLDWAKDEERGASMVEYALLVVLIAIIAIVAIRLAGNNVSSTFSNLEPSSTAQLTNFLTNGRSPQLGLLSFVQIGLSTL